MKIMLLLINLESEAVTVDLLFQVESRRRSRMLLGANDTVNAVLELEGTSPAAALSINQDLGNGVFGGNLQVSAAYCMDSNVYFSLDL